ncbi:MAG: SapC family protein [Halofilum sp. (in: g-proteobacteria)]
MASMLFYQSVAVLNRERHGNLRIQAGSRDCGFAAHTHYVPLVATEFYQAAADYPVLFVGDDAQAAPVALLGLHEGHNPFIDAERQWLPGTYLPAFVRRYPFILARSSEDDAGNMVVCIDENHGGFSTEAGQPLFDDQGGHTEYLNETIQFLQQYQADTERTGAFVQRLNELGLLMRRDIRMQDSAGGDFMLEDFRVVNEKALDQLDAKRVSELHASGYLGWIHAHLVSLTRLEHLPARLERLA